MRTPNDPNLFELELELRSELHDSWSANGAGNTSKVGASKLAIRCREVCLIEHVENVPAKLQRGALGKFQLFYDTEVESTLRLGPQNVSAQAAIEPQGRAKT